MRSFKYFDLDNSGAVSKDEWMKAIEKIGVIVPEEGMLDALFRFYDTDKSGELDYSEFSAGIFGVDSAVGRKSPDKQGGNS
jgi:Ca2+-binding EF-hand superfamily protein|mmetsp:Transcript_18523/g.3017  ORF Transcript_18523/g.3017 Transcript_18523/m.3017 type:complete len:81 (-) Transcript_18523:2191-2433(-)